MVDTFAPERYAVEYLNLQKTRKILWIGWPAIAELQGDAILTNWYNYSRAIELVNMQSPEEFLNWVDALEVESIVMATGAKCHQPGFCVFLEKYTELVFERGPVQVYALKPAFLFKSELLSNRDFSQGLKEWEGSGKLIPGGKTVEVSGPHPLYQNVPAKAGRRYLYSVHARCIDKPGPFRVQVNWHDSKGGFINASITVTQCTTEWQEVKKILRAPPGTAEALVYATGHTTDPVEIDRLSFQH
jgi:hypothetical protein